MSNDRLCTVSEDSQVRFCVCSISSSWGTRARIGDEAGKKLVRIKQERGMHEYAKSVSQHLQPLFFVSTTRPGSCCWH